MKKWPRGDSDLSTDDDVEVDEISDRDLQMFEEMNIDADFNVWDDFRSSFTDERRRSLKETRMSMSSKRVHIEDSITSTSPAILGKRLTNHSTTSSICEDDLEEDQDKRKRESSESRRGSSNGDNSHSEMSFNKLSPAERADIQEWKKRLTREQVFSRYYFPQKWELKEMATIKDFLMIEDQSMKVFLNEPGRQMTKKAINTIFTENPHDPKSVLLKRGPVLFDGTDERELMLFTQGFLFSKVEFDSLVNTLLSINKKHPSLTTMELRAKFDAIDTDGSGSLDRLEMREMFQSLGVPVSEQALTELMQKFDADGNETITFDEFAAVAMSMEQPKEDQQPKKNFWGNLGNRIKRALTASVDLKLDCAFLLSDIEKIESLNICSSEETAMFSNSSWAELAISIFIKGRNEPLILVCSKPQQRAAWVQALGTCLVNSVRFQLDSEEKKTITSQIGWQHRRIRASISSLVLDDDLAGLQKQKIRPAPGVDINYCDPYDGFTALHYAVSMGNLEVATLLLSMGVMVNVKDKADKTPLDHASLAKDTEMVKLLKAHGAEAVLTEGILFNRSKEEQKKQANHLPSTVAIKTQQLGGALGAMSEAMSALRERGEKLEKLDNKTAELQNDAADYADMARKLKEKNKKKASPFGL